MSLITDAAGLVGLTAYELRVYRAMLSESPATAYRLGKRSGVPISRVYEIAERLVAKGVATAIAGRPTRYTPADPTAVVSKARRQLNSMLDSLAAELLAPDQVAVPRGEARPKSASSDWIGWEADKHRRLLQAVHFAPGVRPA
jgi:sugar-specific transcriptional regulator TrmB